MTWSGGMRMRVLAILFTLGLSTPAVGAGLQPGAPPPTVLVTETIQGHLLRIEGESYVIKDDRGKEIPVRTGKDSLIDRTIQVGDLVAAEVWKDGHARSIRKLPR